MTKFLLSLLIECELGIECQEGKYRRFDHGIIKAPRHLCQFRVTAP
jgi:hypothetical protein